MSMISTSSLPVSLAARPSLARRSSRQVRSGLPAASRPASGVCIRHVATKAAAKGPEDASNADQNATSAAAKNLAMLSAAGAAWLSGPGAVHAATDAAAAAASSSDLNLQAMGMEILVYFAKTLISWGIPGAVAIVIVILATARSKGPKKSGDEGDDEVPSFLKPFMAKGKDEIAPKEFLKITPLNDRLESYSYSLTKATDNKARATSERRRQLYKKNFGDFVGDLSDVAVEAVLKAEKAWRKDSAKAQQSVNDATKALRAESVASAPAKDSEDGEGGGMGGMMKGMAGGKKKELQKALTMAVTARAAADDKYIMAVSKVLTKTQREEFTKMLNKKTSPGWQDAEDPIALAPLDGHENKPKRVFVLKFNGDVQASQVKNLREEVTAVIRSAEKEPDDEVLLVLNTGGGTVTGYGLAAAQLVRIKDAGLKLTICVEQVAASGGYMMACCADRIVASPFAVLGSIGVISEQPNVYDRLKREGIEFQTVTAGKYKRTLTPFKKPTEEDFAKNKEDIEQVLVLFKDFVNSQRPAVNIDDVATGETWFGPDALKKGLVDELKTVDDVLLEMLEAGAEIFSVAFSPATNPIQQLVGSPSGSAMSAAGGIFAPLGLLLENAAAAAFARQLEQQQQQFSAQNGIRVLDPNQTADNVKAANGSAADSSSDLWFM